MKKINISDQVINKVISQNFNMESSNDGLMSELLLLTVFFGVFYKDGDLFVNDGNTAQVVNKVLTIS